MPVCNAAIMVLALVVSSDYADQTSINGQACSDPAAGQFSHQHASKLNHISGYLWCKLTLLIHMNI